MGNKKVYLGSAILLLAAAAIGAGLWLQHRAEQKREERKNAIYGYWMTENPKDPNETPACIEINKEQVVLSNLWIPAKSTYLPTTTAEPVVSIDDNGQVTAEATLQGRKCAFDLDKGNPARIKAKLPVGPNPPLSLKRINEKEYYAYWQPLNTEDWSKARHFINAKELLFVGIKFINPHECVFYYLSHKDRERQSIMGKFHAAAACSREINLLAPNGGEPIPLYILDKDTVRIGKNIFRPMPERRQEYEAMQDKLIDKILAQYKP